MCNAKTCWQHYHTLCNHVNLTLASRSSSHNLGSWMFPFNVTQWPKNSGLLLIVYIHVLGCGANDVCIYLEFWKEKNAVFVAHRYFLHFFQNFSKRGQWSQGEVPNSKRTCNIYVSFIIVEFSFHAEKKKFIVWRSENLFSCPRAGKQAVFQL